MNTNSKILWQAYQKFALPLGGKKIFTPYRINIPFQSNRDKYGKSDPATLVKNAKTLAQASNLDLKKMSEPQIVKFLQDNLLGIDCSGFVYHILNYLLTKTTRTELTSYGFPKASLTNVQLLTSNQMSTPIDEFTSAKPGDLIKLNSSKKIPHVLIILQKEGQVITYAHSSNQTDPQGVHTGEIKSGKFPKDLAGFSYQKNLGDGIRRLKILQ